MQSPDVYVVTWLRDKLDERLSDLIASERAELEQDDMLPDSVLDDLTFHVARQIGVSDSDIIFALSDEEGKVFDLEDAISSIETLASQHLSFITIADSFKEDARDYLARVRDGNEDEFRL